MTLNKPLQNHDDFTQKALQGQLPDYGDRRIACLSTSDARSFSGMTSLTLSYVKLGSFSLEAVRQALLNLATFVSASPFGAPGYVVQRVRVKNTVFFDDVTLEFSPYLTTLVGGRGTGKSCLLEYMAHVCGYSRSADYDRPNAKILVLRKGDSQEGTLLPNTDIELHVKLGDKYYRFSRAADASAEVFECADQRCEEGVRVGPVSPSGLLNLRFFGQRELANIVRNEAFFTLDPRQRAGTNLFSFLKSDQLSQVEAKERRARELADGIQKLCIDMSSWARDLSERPKIVSERERLTQDLEKIKRQAAHPALQGHAGYLRLKSNYDGLFACLDETSQGITATIGTIQNRQRRIQTPFPGSGTGVDDSLESLRAAAITQMTGLITDLQGLADSWQADCRGLAESAESRIVMEQVTDHLQEYEKAKKEMEAQRVNLALLEPLQGRLQEIDKRLARFAEIEESLLSSRTRRRQLVEELRQCRAEQSDIYEQLAGDLTVSTRDRVRMKLIRAGDVSSATQEFQESLKDKRRFRSSDAEELAQRIKERAAKQGARVHPAAVWTELTDRLLAHYEYSQDAALGRSAAAPAPSGCPWAGPLWDKARDVVATFDDQQIGQLLCQYVPDSLEMDLRRQPTGEDYISVAQASVGQKATALFLILLAQTDGVLIIDQPEDDLDNAFITNDILPALQELKHKQQVIFATHNANMLVNAESEKVVALETERRPIAVGDLPQIRGAVLYEGGIDNPDLRQHVANILEGGRAAFLARERKYRFDA